MRFPVLRTSYLNLNRQLLRKFYVGSDNRLLFSSVSKEKHKDSEIWDILIPRKDLSFKKNINFKRIILNDVDTGSTQDNKNRICSGCQQTILIEKLDGDGARGLIEHKLMCKKLQ